MSRGATEFQTIRSEGGLLPPDLLRRVVDPAGEVSGVEPTSRSSSIVTRKVYYRPMRSPRWPMTGAARGRTPNPSPKMARPRRHLILPRPGLGW